MIKRSLYISVVLIFLFATQNLTAQEKKQHLNLLFFGDLMLHGPQLNAAYDTETDTYDFSPNFTFIRKYLSGADFCIGNLETTLGTKPYKGYPLFSSPPEIARDIRNAGADVLCTANNHSCDRAYKGIANTLKILDSLHIPHTGTYASRTEEQSQPVLALHNNDFSLALYNATYGTNGLRIPAPASVHLLDKIPFGTIKKDSVFTQAGFRIAFVHWGVEYRSLPHAYQKDMKKKLLDAGFQMIIGSHPHVVEPVERDTIRGTLVAYSLGNFISNQRKTGTDGGMMLRVILEKDDAGIRIHSARYILTWVYKKKLNPENSGKSYAYYILPADEFIYRPSFFEDPDDYNKMLLYIQRTRRLLNEHNLLVPEEKPFTDFWLQWGMRM